MVIAVNNREHSNWETAWPAVGSWDRHTIATEWGWTERQRRDRVADNWWRLGTEHLGNLHTWVIPVVRAVLLVLQPYDTAV